MSILFFQHQAVGKRYHELQGGEIRGIFGAPPPVILLQLEACRGMDGARVWSLK